MNTKFHSIHNLPFEIGRWWGNILTPGITFHRFRVGTCKGLYTATDNTYDIVAITNDQPGNGHFQDVLQWFINSCQRDKKNLRFLEIMNFRFKKHLIQKQGFIEENDTTVIKIINQ